MSESNKDLLEAIFTENLRGLLKKLKSGKATSQDRRVAADICHRNGIGLVVKGGARPRIEVTHQVPFVDPDDREVLA